MFRSSHMEGSDAWYDELETWMRSEGKVVTDETITIERERLMHLSGHYISEDLRFLTQSARSTAVRRAS